MVSAGPGDRLRSCQLRLVEGTDATITVPARSLLRHEPAVVAEFKINVPWAHDPLDPRATIGAAVDIGTTTVALLLCELATGKVLGEASAFNAQIRHGEDVLTRIQHCHQNPAGVRQLQHAVAVETIQVLLAEACAEAKVTPADVGIMTVAANTTMQHLLAGEDPSPLGVHPFTPVFLEHRVYAPADLQLSFGGPDARVHLLPGPAAYVGADLAAGLVATGMMYDDGPVLLVDVGTNGEIIAKVGDRLVGCATAAGPAFEGAGLTSGTRGVKGAIERIALRGQPYAAEVGVIGGGARPIGICGSAYVDFLWESRRAGIVTSSGRLVDEFVARAGAVVQADEYGRKLQLHPHGASGAIWISEVDVARLLQAKAAIAAGINTLLGLLGTTAAEVKTVYLAGGFGLHLSLEHAIGCGLLPGFTPAQIQVVGNTSLGGAFLALHDRSLLAEMKTACTRMESIELNLQPGFEDSYIDQLMLP
ncbi:MAG TPA: ASKHA domain-containing protein [Opitutaceae bacterium]|nr:ASKHA domain-containing protein [Opitutaceae bacterium]HND60041.1 ASKHA domain-containing protein [Opitutaceae bacterium]